MEHIDWTSLFEIEAKLVTSAHPDSSQLLLARLEKQQNSRQSSPRASLSESDDICTIPLDQLQHQVDTYESAIPGITSSPVSQKDLSFWSAAMVSFNDCATRIPHYSCDMVRGGVPPALRGDIWKSMAYTSGGDCGSSEDIASLKYLYDSLANEWTPYVKIIGRDLHRTFPEIDLFREQEGKGQIMMGKVLRAYSAYDMQVGYCQGLTFLVGPLLLHMDDCDAFCVLVKLLENYDLRSMFAADMAGLHLKMFQFESLLEAQLPEIHAHLKSLNINTIYASQWFMSLFAVTCPLPMLVRIYDLMFLEGVTETLMRTAMAILKRNKYNLLNMTEEEDVLQHLLGRRLWDVYGGDGDLLASDITSACLGAPDVLSQLEHEYEAMVEERRRVKEVAKEMKDVAASLPKSRSPKRFFSQGWSLSSLRVPGDRSASVSTNSDRSTRSVSGSGASIVSVDTEIMSQVDYASSVSSFDMSPTAGKTEAAVAALELELQQLRKELEQEKQERKKDREVVGAYIKGAAATDGSLDVLKSQFGDASSSALSYEDLMMQLAESKTNEALAKQQIEDLRDELSQVQLADKDTLAVPKTAAKHSKKESGTWLKW